MNKKLILLFLICAIQTVHAVKYDHLKSDFKQKMYQKQSSLMSNENYMAFLDPYLTEGEKTLVIPRKGLKKKDASALNPYFDLLVTINTTLFFHLVKPSNRTTQSLRKKKEALLRVINEIKAQWKLDFDPKIELENTIALFERANKDYYSRLGFIARAKVAAATTILPLVKR